MTLLFLILMLAALVCFALAAFNVAVGRLNTVALGLLFWALVPFIQILKQF